jgi:phage head maturation protease
VTSEPGPLGPMLQPGTITTLAGPVDAELAALTAALAVSYKTGRALIPGFVPAGPGEVTAYCYAGTEIDWKALMVDIAGAAGIEPVYAVPVTDLRCPADPLVEGAAVERDPDASSYWLPYAEADVEREIAVASATGRKRSPDLTIVFDLASAAGQGDGAMRQLYDKYRGSTVLMAGVDALGTEIEDLARSYGPVLELPNLHGSVTWRDLLAAVTGGDKVEVHHPTNASAALRVQHDAAGRRRHLAADVPEMLEEVRAFFAVEGTGAMRALLEDGHSAASHELKARAKGQGISPGRLWKAAVRLDRDAVHLNGGPYTVTGYAAIYDRWTEVDNGLEGHFLERLSRGSFTRTLAEGRERMKATFCHGKDPELGYKSLGPIAVLLESERGVYYELALVDDADVTRVVVPGLEAGLFGSSFTYRVLAEDLVKSPPPSAHNPSALPERTIREVRCSEFGPVRRPRCKGTIPAGIRSAAPPCRTDALGHCGLIRGLTRS